MRRGVRRAARGRASVRAGAGASRAGRTERQRRRGAKLQKSPRPQGVGLPQTRAGVKTRARNTPPQWGYCLPSGYDLGAFAPRGKVCVYLLQGRGEEKCGRGGCCVAKGRDRPGWLVRGARRYPRGRKRMRRRKAPDRGEIVMKSGGSGRRAVWRPENGKRKGVPLRISGRFRALRRDLCCTPVRDYLPCPYSLGATRFAVMGINFCQNSPPMVFFACSP